MKVLYTRVFWKSPHVWIKIVIGYRMLAREFCIVNREFSNLRRLMNTLIVYMILTKLDHMMYNYVTGQN